MADFTDNPEYRALLAEVCGRREEDTPRLVYADWLEGLAGSVPDGLAARAEFIRVSVKAAVNDTENGWCYQPHIHHPRKELFRLNGFRAEQYRYARGFVSQITLSAADWLAHADALAWHPEHSRNVCKTCDGRGKKAYVIGAFGPFPNGCPRCDGGTTPRPCPPTAQPIGTVVLTGSGRSVLHPRSRVGSQIAEYVPPERDAAEFRTRWPWITFEVRGGNVAGNERLIDGIEMVRAAPRATRQPSLRGPGR